MVRPFFEDRGEELGTKSVSDALIGIATNLEIDLGLNASTYKDVVENGARQLFDLGRGSGKAGDFRAFWTGVLQRGGWWDTTSIISSTGVYRSGWCKNVQLNPVFVIFAWRR